MLVHLAFLLPPTRSMASQEHNTGSIFDDASLWDDAAELPLQEQQELWVVFGTKEAGVGHLYLSDECQYKIHHKAITPIVFLELCFTANRFYPPSNKINRLSHYFQNLRQAVRLELESTKPARLLETTWEPTTLRQWAVRLKHHFHHTPTARALYEQYCIRNGWKPYRHDDPLLYGKFS
jgi:hypothetical protein